MTLFLKHRLSSLHPILVACLLSALLSACQTTPAQQSEDKQQQKELVNDTTPFAVGSSTFFIHDKTRPYDSVAGVNVGVRSMITEVWYPVDHATIDANHASFKRATYGDYVFGDKDAHHLMMTQTTFFHLTPDSVVEGVDQAQIDSAIDELFTRPRQSYIDAPLASGINSLPVVVMSHGDAGSRYNMESACEYLAAHGYLVIAPEHTGNSPFSMTSRDPELNTLLRDVIPFLNEDGTYGSLEQYGQTYTPLIRDRSDPQAMVNLDNSLLQRVNDLRATLVELDKMNTQGRFENRLDLSKIGLMGRSFGGTTTLAALALEERFTAGVAVVPLVTPDFRSSLPTEILKPAGQDSVILNFDGPAALHTINKPTMLLSGAEDSLIIGVGAELAKATGATLPTPDNPLPALRSAYENSNQPVFWGLLEKSNHSSFGVSGGYWWPQYKASAQAYYFNPDEKFDLINVETAHLIQKTKVLQFFDSMIRQDKTASEALIDNQFEKEGLQFESRNF